jgi:hypothetical protein
MGKQWVVTGVFLLSLLHAGCGGAPARRTASAADMQTLGTKSYPTHSQDEVVQAAVTALKVLGYDVVASEPRIRTAPKLAAVSTQAVYGDYSGHSQTFAESVAWDIDVTSEGSGAKLHAVPRASVNGMPMEQVYYDWATTHFQELFKEIDASFGAKP